MSIINTLCASVFLNFIIGTQTFLFSKKLSIMERLSVHEKGGVCGLGIITGIFLVCIFILEFILVYTNNINFIKKCKMYIITIISLYFICQLLMNSMLDYRIFRQHVWNYTGVGLFEYMIPTYIFQILFFIMN